MKTIARKTKTGYTISTADKNPKTGKSDILSIIEPDGGFGFKAGYIRKDADGYMTGTGWNAQMLAEDAKDYFASCSMSDTREIQHPTQCAECRSWVPFGSEGCPFCIAFYARQEEGRRRIAQMFPGIAA